MFGVSFLFPAFLLGGMAIAVPIVLHLLKHEAAPVQPFSAVRFLKRAPVEQSRRKRLRELMLLALRVVALLLLAAAFARPYLLGSSSAATAAVTAIAVDTSMSLSAPGTAEEVRARTLDAIDEAPADHLVGLVAFADEARIVMEASADRAAARAAVGDLVPGFGATRYGPAIVRSLEVIGIRRGRIVFITDVQRSGMGPGPELAVPESVTVEVVSITRPAGNVSVETAWDDDGATKAIVRYDGQVPLSTRVTLLFEGETATGLDVDLTGGKASEVEFGVPWPEAGTLEVRVDDPVGFQGDDARFVIADDPVPTNVLLIGSTGTPADDGFYVVSALSVDDERAGFSVTGTTGDRLSSASGGDDSAPGRVDVMILASTRGLTRVGWDVLGDHVASGRGLLIVLGPGVDSDVVSHVLPESPVQLGVGVRATRALSLAATDLRHPIFRPFSSMAATLGQVRFDHIVPIDGVSEPSGDATVGAPRGHVVARFSDGSAALVELSTGAGAVVLFGSDLDKAWNDFPLHPAFVPFVHETVRHLIGERAARVEYLVGDRPSGMPALAGIGVEPESGRRIAINTDPRESSLDTMSSTEFVDAIRVSRRPRQASSTVESRELERRQSWWRYGLILMLVALAVEGIVGGRMV